MAFSWKLFLDRISTKVNLARRNVLPLGASLNCHFFGRGEESSAHIFLHFECWSAKVRNKKLCKGYWLIWHAVIWVLWKIRNERIFNDTNKGTHDIVDVDDIKFTSWQWSKDHILSLLWVVLKPKKLSFEIVLIVFVSFFLGCRILTVSVVVLFSSFAILLVQYSFYNMMFKKYIYTSKYSHDCFKSERTKNYDYEHEGSMQPLLLLPLDVGCNIYLLTEC